jgi:hypothetical protein
MSVAPDFNPGNENKSGFRTPEGFNVGIFPMKSGRREMKNCFQNPEGVQ